MKESPIFPGKGVFLGNFLVGDHKESFFLEAHELDLRIVRYSGIDAGYLSYKNSAFQARIIDSLGLLSDGYRQAFEAARPYTVLA